MALVMEAEEELELSLGLSLGGSFMRKKSENPRTVTQMDLGFDGGVPTAEENGRKCGFFFGNGRPVVAERNKEAQQLRRRARDRAAKETEAFRLEGRRKEDGKCNDPRSGTMAPLQFPIHPVQYASVRYGYSSPCAMPFWGPYSTQGAASSPGEGPVVETSVGQTKAFRPFRRFNWRRPANAESEQSGGKGGSGGASPSDIQSAYLQGECGADSESHSSGSPLEEDANRNSISQSSAEKPQDPAPVTKPLLAAPAETPLSPPRRRTPSPVTNPESPNLSQDRKSENREQGLPCEGMASLPKMPCVSTTGSGPNGKTITGFLYRYTKADQVSIVCVCHGSSFSPAEFVKHAGGTDVSHPLKHIVIVPSAF